MKIFLTGGTGFIGNSFLKYATKYCDLIYVVSRRKIKSKNKKIKILNGKISAEWSEMKNCDVLVHLASAGVNNKKISYKSAYNFNVKESFQMCKNAFKYNLNRWIIAGSSSEYGRIKPKKININDTLLPKCNYGRTKAIFSKKIYEFSKKKNIYCKILKLFPVYGEGEFYKRFYPSIVNACKKSKNFIVKNGNQFNDFSNIQSVIKKIYKSCKFNEKEKYPQIWHVASGKPILLSKFAESIWKKFKASGDLIVKKKTSGYLLHHISDKRSIL